MQQLTRLIVMHQEKTRRYHLLFGEPVLCREIGGPFCERHLFFEPGQLFGLELWEANRYGTVRWLLAVLRAVSAGERASPLQQVAPGAEILLAVRGRMKVREAREWLRTLAGSGASLAALDPDYYRLAHLMFQARLTPRDPQVPSGRVREFLKRRG